jgi:hypothetical protein
MVDASREGRPAPGTIQQLKLEISNLTRLWSTGGQACPWVKSTVDLLRREGRACSWLDLRVRY